jgi:hypothetical protein
MKNYIAEWAHGESSNPQKQQVSARIDMEIISKIEQLAEIFGVNKTSIIEGALDVGTESLLNDINHKHPFEPMSKEERLDLNMAKAEYEEGKRAFEESKGGK